MKIKAYTSKWCKAKWAKSQSTKTYAKGACCASTLAHFASYVSLTKLIKRGTIPPNSLTKKENAVAALYAP
jgi:hypothetical protein